MNHRNDVQGVIENMNNQREREREREAEGANKSSRVHQKLNRSIIFISTGKLNFPSEGSFLSLSLSPWNTKHGHGHAHRGGQGSMDYLSSKTFFHTPSHLLSSYLSRTCVPTGCQGRIAFRGFFSCSLRNRATGPRRRRGRRKGRETVREKGRERERETTHMWSVSR